ncbi:MAG: IS110 family transposase [Actinomycetota bacterium]
MGVAIGVDSHKSTLAAAALDELGRVIGTEEFTNDDGGHDALLEWVMGYGADRVIGIEGTGTFGAAVARRLLAVHEDVKEVPPFLPHRDRRKNPTRGKSDLRDAVAIARVVARGETLSSPRRVDIMRDLKLLGDHRDQLVRARTQLINRTHQDLVVSHPGYEKRIPKLTSKKRLREARTLLRGDASVRADLIRDRIAEISRLIDKVAGTERQIAAKVVESGTRLTQLRGIGFLVAAKILGEVGDPARLRSKSSFAMLTGTAPIEASSGKTKRHRLNRGGNRQLNYALYVMALARRRGDTDTRAYLERLREAGKSDREALRCLKRQLSNVVFRQLVSDFEKTANRAA